jgi:hypothetical protein
MLVMWFCRQGAADREHQTLREHVACLFEKDGWAFSLIYIVTFGGFIGLASFLPTYFYDQFKVTKVEAGPADDAGHADGLGGARVGGYVSDRIGGIKHAERRACCWCRHAACCAASPAARWRLTTLLFMLCFARWAPATARCSSWCRCAGRCHGGGRSMIGEVGALGGGFMPNAMGPVQAVGRHLPVGLRVLRRARAADAPDAAAGADPLDAHLGEKGVPRTARCRHSARARISRRQAQRLSAGDERPHACSCPAALPSPGQGTAASNTSSALNSSDTPKATFPRGGSRDISGVAPVRDGRDAPRSSASTISSAVSKRCFGSSATAFRTT